MRSLSLVAVGILVLGTVAMTGCSSKKTVTRLETDTVTDLSGRWNDTDSRLVAEEMIGSALSMPWLSEFHRSTGKNPVIIAGSIQNRSHEHIETRTFLKDIQRALLQSGQVSLVADSGEREEVRDERLDQLENADPQTVKRLGMELGADFMLSGEINTIVDQEEGVKVVFYQVDLQLINIETNAIVWMEEKKIKKGITQGKYKT